MKWTWKLFGPLLLFSTTTLLAADPVVPPPTPVKPDVTKAVTLTLPKTQSVMVGKKCIITATTTAKKVTWKLPPGLDYVALDAKSIAIWGTPDVYPISAHVPSGDEVITAEMVLTLVGPKPPDPAPVPPGPGPGPNPPTPPAPAPGPVTSFQVIWVVESGTTPPLGQIAVAESKQVRDYLTANTTAEGQWAGWRRYDPQENTANESPVMKALWAAVQPKITTIPCVVIAVNGKADILPYPATPADALALFRKYNGGK